MNKKQLIVIAMSALVLISSPVHANKFKLEMDTRIEGLVDLPASDADDSEQINTSMQVKRMRLNMQGDIGNDWSARVRLRFDKSADKDQFSLISKMVNYAYIQKKYNMFSFKVGVIDEDDGFEDEIIGSTLFIGSPGAGKGYGNIAGLSGKLNIAKQNLTLELTNSNVTYSSDENAQVYPNMGLYYKGELKNGLIQPLATYTFQPSSADQYFKQGTTVFGGGIKLNSKAFEASLEYAGNKIDSDGDVSDDLDELTSSIIFIGALKGIHSPLVHLSFNSALVGGEKKYNSAIYSAAYRYSPIEKVNLKLVAAVSGEYTMPEIGDASNDMKINIGIQGKFKLIDIKD